MIQHSILGRARDFSQKVQPTQPSLHSVLGALSQVRSGQGMRLTTLSIKMLKSINPHLHVIVCTSAWVGEVSSSILSVCFWPLYLICHISYFLELQNINEICYESFGAIFHICCLM